MLALAAAVSVLAATPTVELQSRVAEGKPTAAWKYVKLGEPVTLVAKPNGAPVKGTTWFKLEPTTGSIDNTTPSFHFADIGYVRTELTACRGKLECAADVRPTALPMTLEGVGTMGYQVEVVFEGGKIVSTPGLDSREYGGLSRKVHKVAVRRDDSYLGYLTELFNTPYIFGSAGPDGRNQSDLLIGSDCADLAVYGQRRLGKKTPYVSSYTIDTLAKPVATVKAAGGAIRFGDKEGELKAGDVIHFPSSRHVGILWEDRAPVGELGPEDLMVHTCWAPPKIEPIWASGCSSFPTRFLRFP